MKRGVKLSTVLVFVSALGLNNTRAASFHTQDPAAPGGTAADLPQDLKGETRTLLPDGTWLTVGGEGEHGPLGVAAITDTATSKTIVLSSSLHHARAGHTATLLPDGTVLILGGVDASGSPIDEAESFDPVTRQFAVLPSTGLS